MLAIRRILYPTDFSESARQVLDHALFLAERHEAELHMLHAVVLHDHDPAGPEQRFPEPKELFEHLFAVADSEMARLAGDSGTRTFTLKQVSRRGFSVPEVILDYGAEIDADLIVMGTHGRSGAGRFLLGSTAARVVHQARCPVLTLRQRPGKPPLEAIERLLVPVDFSEHSLAALEAARELALTYRASLDLLHVYEEPPHPYFYTPVGGLRVAEHFAATEQAALAELEKLVGTAGSPELEVRRHVERGRPGERITEFAATHDSDMIVLSTHGLSGLERLLIGSTAEEVVRTAACPVLTVKAFGKSLTAGGEG